MATSGAWHGETSPLQPQPSPSQPDAITPARGAMGPLHEPLFRSLWIAAVISYTGTWMQNVGAAWLMTSLTMSPLMVGLVQAAGSIAVFLVVLPAGALADMVDRRKLLLFTQTWMVVAAVALAALTLAGKITPGLLLLLTFLMGFGAVLNDPAWQAITPEIVSRENFAAGVAWNSAGFNVARAIGPAFGGLIIAVAGSGVAFLLNAVSFFGVIYFLYRWKQRPVTRPLNSRRMLSTMFDGVRHMRDSRQVKAVLVRSAVFSISAGALPALLPLLAHPFGSRGYGLLLGFFGVGALTGAAFMPLVRRHIESDALVSMSTAIFAFTTYAAPEWCTFALLSMTMFVAGVAWIQILASLNVAAQTMCPGHMRARAIAMYLLVLQGGLAGGAALWGEIAELVGTQRSLTYAAIALLAGIPAATWFRLPSADLQPSTAGMD